MSICFQDCNEVPVRDTDSDPETPGYAQNLDVATATEGHADSTPGHSQPQRVRGTDGGQCEVSSKYYLHQAVG